MQTCMAAFAFAISATSKTSFSDGKNTAYTLLHVDQMRPDCQINFSGQISSDTRSYFYFLATLIYLVEGTSFDVGQGDDLAFGRFSTANVKPVADCPRKCDISKKSYFNQSMIHDESLRTSIYTTENVRFLLKTNNCPYIPTQKLQDTNREKACIII